MAGTGEAFGPCPHCGQLHAEDVLICASSDKVLALEGRILDGKFRFTRQLGEGGMGTVWMADNVLVHKTVAIKLMHVQFSRDEGVLARFRNEATAAGRIGSKYICDILDLGKSTLGPYIVMEMLSGSDFAGFVQKNHPVEPGTVVMIMRQALIGLQAAHDAGIVHRDLKPENIFLHEPEPGHLLVKLMDFGISKFTEGNEAGKTGMGVLMGTPEYMSPEQTEGAAQVDHRTDIWAMGVILYWALAGRNPFLGPTMAATLMNVSMREAPPLSQTAPHVPTALADIVGRCIAKEPDARYASATQLSDALAPFEQLTGKYYVPYASKTGGTAMTGTNPAALTSSPPPPGGTVASSMPPVSRPTPAGAPTFSNEISVAPGNAAPTLGGDSTFSFAADDDHYRPETNMGGSKGLIIFLVVLLLGGGGLLAWNFTRTPSSTDAPDDVDAQVAAAADTKDEKSEDTKESGDDEDTKEPGDEEDTKAAGDEEDTKASGDDDSKQSDTAGAADSGDDPPKEDPPKEDPPKKDPPKKDPPRNKINGKLVGTAGRLYYTRTIKSNVSQDVAKNFCNGLKNFGGVPGGGWSLPNEGQASSLKRTGMWWTTKGGFRAETKKTATLQKSANAFCVKRK